MKETKLQRCLVSTMTKISWEMGDDCQAILRISGGTLIKRQNLACYTYFMSDLREEKCIAMASTDEASSRLNLD